MPETADLCRKCRAGFTQVGDSWCRVCSSAAALSELAKRKFAFEANRALGEEIVVQATRQFRSLVELDKNTQSQVVSLTDRLRNAQDQLKGTAVAKRSASKPAERGIKRERSPTPTPRPSPPRDEGDYDESDYESEEEEEREEDREVRGRPSGNQPPPLPENSPPRREPAEEREEPGPERRRFRERGGKKHKRRYRQLHQGYHHHDRAAHSGGDHSRRKHR